MSSREFLLKRTQDALKPFIVNTGWPQKMQDDMAEVVLDAILPLITDPKQLLGVPEQSILISEHETVWRWERGHLREFNLLATAQPEAVLLDGPLTVVWMP